MFERRVFGIVISAHFEDAFFGEVLDSAKLCFGNDWEDDGSLYVLDKEDLVSPFQLHGLTCKFTQNSEQERDVAG